MYSRVFTLGTGRMIPATEGPELKRGDMIRNEHWGKVGVVLGCDASGRAPVLWLGDDGNPKDRGEVLRSAANCNSVARFRVMEAKRTEEQTAATERDFAEREAKRRAADAESWERAKEIRDRGAALVAASKPEWAKAALFAEHVEDDSDLQSDYFGHKTTRTVFLGWSKHERDIFPEMRKAAANFPETAHLVGAGPEAEHREKYSMGGGYYLKAESSRHSTGWSVCKRPLRHCQDVLCVAFARGDVFTGAPEAAAPSADSAPCGAYRIEKHFHTKGGFDMWIAVPAERLADGAFDAELARCKAAGGWYSRAWGKTPGGFAFKAQDAATAFAGSSEAAATASPTLTAKAAPKARDGAKFLAMADSFDKAAEDMEREPSRLKTPKQNCQYARRLHDAQNTRRAAQIARALAEHEGPGLPSRITKGDVAKWAARPIQGGLGYYECRTDWGKWSDESAEAKAARALLEVDDSKTRDAARLRELETNAMLGDRNGFFPTPREIVQRMVHLAGIPEGASVLEPSAGTGAILDVLREMAPGARATCGEWRSDLREILKLKGHAPAFDDFTAWQAPEPFARVLMNPPFEKGQDCDHIRRAFNMLAPGGRLVAICSEGVFSRSTRKESEFRAWLDGIGATTEKLPAGAFEKSGTGVATRIVVADKRSAQEFDEMT